MSSGRAASLVSLTAGPSSETDSARKHSYEFVDLLHPDLESCRPAYIELPVSETLGVAEGRHVKEVKTLVARKFNRVFQLLRHSGTLRDADDLKTVVARPQSGLKRGYHYPAAKRTDLSEETRGRKDRLGALICQSQTKKSIPESHADFQAAIEELCILMARMSLRDTSPDSREKKLNFSSVGVGRHSRISSRRESISSTSSSDSSSSLQTLVEEDLCEVMDRLSLRSPKLAAIHDRQEDLGELSSFSERTEWWDELAFLNDDTSSTPKGADFLPELDSLKLYSRWDDEDQSGHFTLPEDDTASSWQSTIIADFESDSGETAVEPPAVEHPVETNSVFCTFFTHQLAWKPYRRTALRICSVGIRGSWHVPPQDGYFSLFAPAFLSWAASGTA